jgi:hypothetical protein
MSLLIRKNVTLEKHELEFRFCTLLEDKIKNAGIPAFY